MKGVDFARGAKAFTLKASGEGAVQVKAGETVLCEFVIQGEAEYTLPCASFTGTADVVLTFLGNVNADWWQVTPAE